MRSAWVFRGSIFLFLLTLSTTASAFCTRTSAWTADVLLHDGRVIKINREVCFTFQLFYGDGGSPGMFGSWPDKHWLKFEHPDTHETIKWQGEQYFYPFMLDFVDGVPYLVVNGRTDKDTEKIYGCPELPYIVLKYEKGFFGKWTPISIEQFPDVLKDANLSVDGASVDENKHASLDAVQRNIRDAEQRSAGGVQAKIPRNYDTWHSVYKDSDKNERRKNDCRPPPKRPLPSPEFEVERQRIIQSELKAETVNATIESFAASSEVVTGADFARSKGAWTGHGYLSNRCDGIVKTIAPIREYFDNGGWHLTGSQLVLNSGKVLPFQQAKLSKFQAPSIPQLVTCGNNTIYAVSRGNKENILIHRFTYSGEMIDALHISLPGVDNTFTGKEWGEIWEVMPMKDQLSIALAVYTYASTANQGGTITKKQTYAVKLPKLLILDQDIVNPAIKQEVDKTPASTTMQQSALKSFRDCPACPEMIVLPGKNYAIGKYEVTQAEWSAIIETPARARGSENKPDQPVTTKTWDYIQSYITKLKQMTGKDYRLPTEAEWEFACYGGSQTEYCGGDNFDAVGWGKENSKGLLQPVGQKKPNGYGLYDMSGNAWEWAGDCWKGNCDVHLILGGSYMYYPMNIRTAYMYGTYDRDIGFRLAGTLNGNRDGLLTIDTPAENSERMPRASASNSMRLP